MAEVLLAAGSARVWPGSIMGGPSSANVKGKDESVAIATINPPVLNDEVG